MRNIDCRNIRREIEEVGSADLLSPAGLSHLATCPACETLSRQQTKLQAIVSGLGTVEAPGDFDFRLRARLAGEKRGHARSLPLGGLSFGLRSAAVAAILLLMGSVLVLVSFRTRPDNPVAGGNPVAPQPAAPGSAPKQIEVPAGVTPGTSVVAEGPGRNGSGPIEVGLKPSKHTEKRLGARSEIAAIPKGKRFGTLEQGVRPAPVMTRDSQLVESYPTAAFPINASYQSLKVSVDDRRGASRTISLPSVSFGSQRTLSQNSSPLLARGAW